MTATVWLNTSVHQIFSITPGVGKCITILYVNKGGVVLSGGDECVVPVGEDDSRKHSVRVDD